MRSALAVPGGVRSTARAIHAAAPDGVLSGRARADHDAHERVFAAWQAWEAAGSPGSFFAWAPGDVRELWLGRC